MQLLSTLGPLVNVVMICGALWAYFAHQEDASANLAQKFADFQAGMNSQLAAIETTISSLPGQSVTLTQIEEHLHVLDQRLDNFDQRLRSVETAEAADRADLNNIISSDHVPLGPRRR